VIAAERRPARHRTFPATEKVYSSPRSIRINMNLFVCYRLFCWQLLHFNRFETAKPIKTCSGPAALETININDLDFASRLSTVVRLFIFVQLICPSPRHPLHKLHSRSVKKINFSFFFCPTKTSHDVCAVSVYIVIRYIITIIY